LAKVPVTAAKLAGGLAGEAVEAGRASGVSACTVNVESVKIAAAAARETTAAPTQIHRDLMLFDRGEFCRSTILIFY
jgi:hypothetical protein